MDRICVDHVSGVGIIFRESDPSQIFIEIKDDGLPIKAFRRGLCPIGGNWIGEPGKKDQNTLDTFRREFNEEITCKRMIASTLELHLLGHAPEGNFYQTPRTDYTPSDKEIETLDNLKKFITNAREPFGDYIIDMPKAVFDRADPDNKQEGFNVLVSYWLVALSEKQWGQLVDLQNKLANLSNESITIITSLKEIVDAGIKSSYGHDRPLQEFFSNQGFQLAYKLPLTNGIICRKVGMPLASYSDYLDIYDVKRKP
jgi:hypothetical protein